LKFRDILNPSLSIDPARSRRVMVIRCQPCHSAHSPARTRLSHFLFARDFFTGGECPRARTLGGSRCLS
jgi:hypothetical protein